MEMVIRKIEDFMAFTLALSAVVVVMGSRAVVVIAGVVVMGSRAVVVIAGVVVTSSSHPTWKAPGQLPVSWIHENMSHIFIA